MLKETMPGLSQEQEKIQEAREEFEDEVQKDLEQKGKISTGGIKELFKSKGKKEEEIKKKIIDEIQARAEKENQEREQKQIPKWDELTLDEKQNLLIDSNCPSFRELRRSVGGASERGEILKTARNLGKLSPEIDSWIIDIIRGVLHMQIRGSRAKIGDNENFISKLEKIAKAEPEIEETINKYSEIITQARQIKEKRHQKQPLSDEEQKIYEQYKNLLSSINKISYASPAKFILHFYRNGDLKWLWGITKQDTARQVGNKNDGGRVGNSQDADW